MLAKICCSYGYCLFGEVMVTQPQFVAFRGFVIMAQKLFLDDNAFTAHLGRFFFLVKDIWTFGCLGTIK